MALLDIGNAWQSDENGDVFKRFLGACLVAAASIVNEDPGTANHERRMAWARGVLSNDAESVRLRVRAHVRRAAATNTTFQGNPAGVTDNDIQFIVNSQIDLLS